MGVSKGHGDSCAAIMLAQITLLTAFGVIPSTDGKKSRFRFLSKIPVATILFVIGGFVLFLGQIGMVFYRLFAVGGGGTPDYKFEIESIVHVLSDITYGLTCLRGVFVLIFLAKHRHAWPQLIKRTDKVIQKICLHDASYPAFSHLWKRGSIMSAVLTLIGVLTIEGISWATEFIHKYDQRSWTATNSLAPLPMPLAVWQYFIGWFVFCTIPFYLSLQVCGCLLIFGKILADSVRVLNGKLEEMIKMAKFDYGDGQMEKGYEDMADRCGATTKSVENIIVLHLEIVHLSDSLNSVFGGLFCAAYCLDVVTMLSFVVALLAGSFNATEIPTKVLEDCLGLIVFCVYCVVFYLPLIASYEQGIKFNQSFSRLSNALLPISRTAAGKTLFTLLQIFTDGNTEPLIEFNGAELIHVTRVFVVKTFAFIASMAVISYRIISKQHNHSSAVVH